MKKKLIKKLAISLVNLLVAMIISFSLYKFMPGDFIEMKVREVMSAQGLTWDEAYERVIANMNYDPNEPVLVSLKNYIGNLVRGNLGSSIMYQTLTVNQIVAKALPWTLFVLTVANFISYLIGLNLGSLLAWKRGSIFDSLIALYTTIIGAIPDFIIAILLLILFSFRLGWFPTNGSYNPMMTPGFNLPFILSVFHYGFLPILTYVLVTFGGIAIGMKGNCEVTLSEDYITAARARGIPEKIIRKKYVKKNARVPVITGIFMSIAAMFAGTPLVEGRFGYPGMGHFMGVAITRRDYPVIQGFILITSASVIIANLITDLLYAKLDPRIRE